MIKDKEKHLKDIMLVFALTEEDLQANRRGDITPSQLQKMQRTQFMGALMAAGMFFLIGAVFYGILLFSWDDIMRHMERGELGLQLTLGGFFMVLPTLSVIVGLVMMFMWWRNKDDVEVSQTEGVVQMRNYRIRRNEFFEMKLNGMTFPLSQNYFYAIKNGVRYRIYYVDSTKHLLALEPLEQA